jgi:hypothetical protein
MHALDEFESLSPAQRYHIKTYATGLVDIMVSTRSENWLRIRGVEVCFCLFIDSIGSVNRGFICFSSNPPY